MKCKGFQEISCVITLNINKILSLILYTVFFWDKVNLSRIVTKPAKWHVCPAKTQISLGIRCPHEKSLGP